MKKWTCPPNNQVYGPLICPEKLWHASDKPIDTISNPVRCVFALLNNHCYSMLLTTTDKLPINVATQGFEGPVLCSMLISLVFTH